MTTEPHRRRSKSVNLVLVGVAGTAATLVGGCSSTRETFQRNVYASMEDCAKDYTLAVCSAKGTQSFGKYLGPTYRLANGIPSRCKSDDPGDGQLTRSPKLATQIERSGFGVSCSRRSSSSSRSGGRSFFSGG